MKIWNIESKSQTLGLLKNDFIGLPLWLSKEKTKEKPKLEKGLEYKPKKDS